MAGGTDATRPATRSTWPASRSETWDALAGYDAVWLMGVWQRSPAGVAIAMTNTALTDSFEAALPGYEPADVAGSPYCIRDYVVDSALGGPAGLAVAGRSWLAAAWP